VLPSLTAPVARSAGRTSTDTAVATIDGGNPSVSTQARAADRPATFGEVFGNPEYRSLYSSAALTWFGEYLARAAVTALVYQSTESVAASAAAFATSYLPWVVGGPLLAAIAERYRYRAVMITCDLIRMSLIALVAMPGVPIPLMIGLLFLVALANPPAQAARSAMMPLVLTGDRLVVGLSLNQSTGQAAQVVGYMAGAALAPFYPRVALLIDAATFACSAVILRLGLHDRPPALAAVHRSHLLQETADGFRLVFGSRVLRAIAVIVFCSVLFAIVPEGLAAAWAADLVGNNGDTGVIQGVIMVANPIGWIAGGLLVGRLVGPETRRRLIRVFAALAPLALVPAVANPPVAGVVAMAAACGFCAGALMPAANGLFVQALPNGFRARAFGVMQGGIQVLQGAAVLITGLAADAFPLPVVVGVWSAGGVLLLTLVGMRWPNNREIEAAVTAAAEVNAAGAGSGLPGPRPAAKADPVDWHQQTNNHRPARHAGAGGGPVAAEGGAGDATPV
jgi:MFS family permease